MKRNYSKYSDELILESVQRIIRGEQSVAQTARLLGAGSTYVRRLVAMYKQHGPEGLFKREGSYSGEFKLHILFQYRVLNATNKQWGRLTVSTGNLRKHMI